MSQSPELVPRTEPPPRWALGLLALLLMAVAAALFLGLQSMDPTRAVAGNPAGFPRPSEAPSRAPGQEPPGQKPPAREPGAAMALGQVTNLDMLLKEPADRPLVGRNVSLEDVPSRAWWGTRPSGLGRAAIRACPWCCSAS